MSYAPRPYLLAETNWKAVRETRFTTAVLPWGATEAHNHHLPYGTDNYQAEHVAGRAAARAWDMGARLLVLPGIPYGVNTGQLDVEFCMNLMPSTQLAILKDMCDVLVRHGVTRLVLFNGHGANNFQPLIRELAGHWPQLFVCSVNWFQAGDRRSVFEEPGDHADELETSVMLHIAPELVRPLDEAGDGANRRFGAEGFRRGWAWAQRPWTLVTRDTGSGCPYKATADKGRAYLDQAVDAIAGFLYEVSTRSVEEMLTD